MKKNRVGPFLLAIVIVYAAAIIISKIPFQHIYQGITNPKADRDDVIEQLVDSDANRRIAGLNAYHFGLSDDAEVDKLLLQIVLNDPDKEARKSALKILVAKTSVSISQIEEKPQLEITVIDQIAGLLDDERTDENLLLVLLPFLDNTAKWQSRPLKVIQQLTTLIEETEPVFGEEYYADIARIDRRRAMLQALKGYARFMMLPDATLELLLPIYTGPDKHPLNIEVAYIYQYHAINGPLTERVRQAVIEAMQRHPNKQLRLAAIMTMEWIGKQEGQMPDEVFEVLEKETDPQIRSNISQVVLRMQQNPDDPLNGLLLVISDLENPVSLRTNAMSNAALYYGKDPRTTETLLAMTRDHEANMRATAVFRLPNDQLSSDEHGQTNELLPYLDRALKDPDPVVRSAAVAKIRMFSLPFEDKLVRLEQALLDNDDKVFISASETIRQLNLHSEVISEHIAKREGSLNPAALHSARLTQQKIHGQTRGLWQNIVEITKDTRQHGVRLYWILAAIGILIAAGFSIYYVYRILIFIQQKRRRRIYAVVGVLITWTGLTYAVVALFVIGAFSFGHNYLVPPRDQIIIDLVMTSGLLLYLFFGWMMKKLINRNL